MKIYFDNVLINEDYYKSLTNTHNLFNGNFILGSTASNTFTLELDVLATSTTPEVIKITDNDEDYATLVIDKVEDVDKYTKSYKLTDKLVDLNYYYDASEFINQNGGSALTSEILADMCSKIGLEVDENINWINDIPVTWYDNTILAREYAGYIAEINAGYIFILPNGKLTIKQHKMASKYTINVDDCENFTLGERHIISKVVYDNGVVKYEAGDDTGNTLYLDTNNVFIVSQAQITKIYNSIVGFEFYSVETGNCPISKDVRAGDVITFVDGDNEYPTIANIDLSYNGGWNGGYSLDINTERQEETDTIGTNTKIKGIITRLNRDEAQLEVIATETDENSEKIGQLELDYEEINLKVSEITDFVKDVSNMGSITLENAAQNIINSLSISGSISLLFGNDGQTYGAPVYFSDDLYFNDNLYFSTGVPLAEVLYPSSNLFGKNMNLIIEYQVTGEDGSITTQQDIIPLPFKYLNYMNSEIYDEFIVENSIAKVIRRVGVNSDMQLYELPNEVVEELGELTINLHEGTNKIYMQCFTNAILSASYVTQNEFTDNFVTHSEFNAGLDITSTSIKQEVNAQFEGVDGEIQEINGSLELKLNTDDLTTEFNAHVDEIHLEGLTTINDNFKILEDGSMEAKNGKFNGSIELISAETTPRYTIKDNTDSSIYYTQSARVIRWFSPYGQLTAYVNESEAFHINLRTNAGISNPNIENTDITPLYVKSTEFLQLSFETIKKNIELFNESAINIIKNADLYSYNLKKENDDDKKHIGLIIGDGEKKYNTPDEIITQDKQGIDLYSMISLSWKAIQEQQKIIEDLQAKIDKLEKGE